MDSWDSDPVRSAFWNQAQCPLIQEEQMKYLRLELHGMVARQEGLLAAASDKMSTLTSQFIGTSTSLQDDAAIPLGSMTVHTSPTMPIQLARPEKVLGNSGNCQSFWT